MSHSPLCLWKKKLLSRKLKRQVSLEDVHFLCEYLGFTDAEQTIAWIESASPAEILEILARRKKRRDTAGEEFQYVYIQ